MTKRWPGSNPLWPEPATGVTDLRIATGEAQASGEHRDWIENHDPVLRLARARSPAAPTPRQRLLALDAAVAGADRRRGQVRARQPPARAGDGVRPRIRVRDINHGQAKLRRRPSSTGSTTASPPMPRASMIGSYVLGLGPQRQLMDRIRERLSRPYRRSADLGGRLGRDRRRRRDGRDAPVRRSRHRQLHLSRLVADHQRGGGRATTCPTAASRAGVTFHLLHGVRGGGAAQHSHSPQAMLCNAPGLEIVAPSAPPMSTA